MKMNVGKIDRVIRIVLGLVLLSLVFLGPHTSWGFIGLIPLLTGMIGVCPVYSLFGINTCQLTDKRAH